MADASRRTRRPTKSGSKKAPSAAHYVGYVEDGESVQAIMAKFAAMEEYLSSRNQTEEPSATGTGAGDPTGEPLSAPPVRPDSTITVGRDSERESDRPMSAVSERLVPDAGISVADLEEIYRRTAIQPVQMLGTNWIYSTGDEVVEEKQLRRVLAMDRFERLADEDDAALFFMDIAADNDEFWELEFGGRRRKRKRGVGEPKEPKEPKEPREPKPKRVKPLPAEKKRRETTVRAELQDEFGRKFVFKKRCTHADPRIPKYTRLPPALEGWAHIIEPYVAEPPVPPGARVVEADILSTDLTAFGEGFQAIVIDPPLRHASEPPTGDTITVAELAQLDLSSRLIASGLVCIWLEKSFTPHVVAMAEAWGLKYVENIVWVRVAASNRFHAASSPFFNSSKLTLMIFKKEGEMDLRHQRNADVIFDFVAPLGGREAKPQFVYTTLETLLPRANYDPADPIAHPGRLLELWSPPGAPLRTSWTKVVDTRTRTTS